MVTCCVCCDISFETLLQRARATGSTTPDELHRVAFWGEGCGLCAPYVAIALREGRAAIAVGEAAGEMS